MIADWQVQDENCGDVCELSAPLDPHAHSARQEELVERGIRALVRRSSSSNESPHNSLRLPYLGGLSGHAECPHNIIVGNRQRVLMAISPESPSGARGLLVRTSGSARILVAEDPFISTFLRTVLQRHGHKVVTGEPLVPANSCCQGSVAADRGDHQPAGSFPGVRPQPAHAVHRRQPRSRTGHRVSPTAGYCASPSATKNCWQPWSNWPRSVVP